MRASAIPTAIIDALNELFDTNPEAMRAALRPKPSRNEGVVGASPKLEKELDDAVMGNVGDGAGMVAAMQTAMDNHAKPVAKPVTMLDVINTVLHAISPGKQVCLSMSADGVDGFVLGRVKPTPQPE